MVIVSSERIGSNYLDPALGSRCRLGLMNNWYEDCSTGMGLHKDRIGISQESGLKVVDESFKMAVTKWRHVVPQIYGPPVHQK